MTTFTADHSNFFENASSPAFVHTSESFHYALTHVFLPVKLPDHNDFSLEKDLALGRTVCDAAHAYSAHVCENSEPHWHHITRMLDKLQVSLQSEHMDKDSVISELRGMRTGDILTLFIQRQNAAAIVTKRENSTLFESFGVSPREDVVEKAAGSLICSYPWSAVEVSNEVFNDWDFQLELTHFLSLPNAVNSDLPLPPAAHPEYITALLSGILRGVGRIADASCITKRIRDDVGRPEENNAETENKGVWRRSSLWLLIRVAIQMSVDRSPLGRASYKRFMLFFMCTFAMNAKDKDLSSNLLHLISSKILRRRSKFRSAMPHWLSEIVLETCACLQEVLDARWTHLQSIHSNPSPFRNPSQRKLRRAMRLSLLGSRDYIRDALENRHREPLNIPFHPSHRRRGTIDDFLSPNGANFFDRAFDVDPDVTLYDIEKSVEQDIDEWFARVTDVDEACAQLEVLMDRYMAKAHKLWDGNPEDSSIILLTALELLIVTDKLAVKEIPLLADYPPDIPTDFLETLLLRKETSLHRLSLAYQYLSARHSQSRPGWSVLSDEFTEDSFPVRYYDQSPDLQLLKARIDQDAMEEVVGYPSPHTDAISIGQRQDEGGDVSQSCLPPLPLHAKVVVFELRCPPCVRICRSAAPRILHYFPHLLNHFSFDTKLEERDLLSRAPPLQPYFVHCERTPLAVQIHFACLFPGGLQSRKSLQLRYAIQYRCYTLGELGAITGNSFSIWRRKGCPGHSLGIPNERTYRLYDSHPGCSPCKDLAKYVDNTSHTSNDVLAAQAGCPVDLSLDQFIAFAHLRSGGLLQWMNILQGLRSRTLNFRHHHVHYLLSHAAFQVGPLDLNTGTWIWHQELLNSSFCNTLLGELDSLFVDAAVGSIDGMIMSTISLLLTRILASSPSKDISKAVISLLRKVRRKTFDWVQELSYNLAKAPTNKERSRLLLEMAATCRSTFDVDSVTLHKLFHSAEDIDAALSCALLIPALLPERIRRDHPYSLLLLQRNRRLSFALEETLGNVILADVSNHGVDLAVSKIFVCHKPSAHAWKRLEYTEARWFTCKTRATGDRPSQIVHLNLLNGTLRVDAKSIGGLPHAIRNNPKRREIFRDQGFFAIPSNLPGMDFTTLCIVPKYKVHFSLRGNSVVVRAQYDQSNDILELIPASKLQEDLPPALLLGHVHWLNLSTKIIEIRPFERLWEQSSENWKIDCTSGRYRMYKGRETLVDIRSSTWAMVSNCFQSFKCLESFDSINSTMVWIPTENLLITVSPVTTLQPVLQLSVALPRYGLSFFVNSQGELESRDFKNMVYDKNKCIGALFGLENLLVLRQKAHLAEELIPRRVLIPNDLHFEKHGGYEVGINNDYSPCRAPKDSEPLYYTYNVDTELGCLVGDGSSTSTQLLARLHAMTSCDRPDPLTGKTGAQAALHLLQSAGCRSIMKPNTSRTSYSWDWNITQYPQIKTAHELIRHHSYMKRYLHHNVEVVGTPAARRAVHLFPPNAAGSTPEDLEGIDHVTLESNLQLEGVAFAAAYAVHRRSIDTLTMNAISDWAAMWSGDTIRVDPISSPFQLPDGLRECSTNNSFVRTLHGILKREETRQRFQLLFLLPTMAYCSPCPQVAFLSMLMAIATKNFESQCFGNPPIRAADCKILDGYLPTAEILRRHFRDARLEPAKEDLEDWEKDNADNVIKNLLKDWPSSGALPTVVLPTWISHRWDRQSLTTNLQQQVSSCNRNFKLKEHLICLLTEPTSPTRLCPVVPTRYISNDSVQWEITLDQLLSSRLVPELPPRRNLLHNSGKGSSDDTSTLNELFSLLANQSSFALKWEYIALLEKSAQCVRGEYSTTHSLPGDHIHILEQHYVQCRVNYLHALRVLRKSLDPTIDPHQQALSKLGQWPAITADVLLRCLASTSPISLPQQWKKCLTSLALLLLDLQRARRLLRYALDGLEEEFSQELENEGCDGWDPEEYPDWLLIQIQGNFLIRRSQAGIAMEMMSPKSGENTVMQVKMGEGKSSVIIPIAAAALADGKQLVRIIVPKALTVQMFESLVSRLGGLANRQIHFLPFSRPTEQSGSEATSQTEVKFNISDVRSITHYCMAKRGVLLVQPEHVASLKLKSVEEQMRKGNLAAEVVPNMQKLIYKYISTVVSLKLLPDDSLVGNMFQWLSKPPNHLSKKDTAPATSRDKHAVVAPDSASDWLNLQNWFDSYARDILDESDEILHSRLQLIYTVGLQQHPDGYSDRWTITQKVLHLVKRHLYSLSRYAPDLMEYECGPPGSFPYIHVLRPSDVGQHLVSLIVEDVMAGQLPNLKFLKDVSPALHDAIRCFISDEDVLQVPDTAKKVEEYAKLCSQQVWSGLLLLRGLLTSNVLLSALADRRWRVDYGLVPPPVDGSRTPTMLAVPYRAKDMPAPNTHFGHPDIAIILTCLSYYYGGLNEKQLKVSFETLLDEDDPSTEYALWVEEYDGRSLPDSLRTLGEINLRSSEQWDKIIYPLFKRNQTTIDFYLSRVVFPEEMKEYPWKLCASSWDLAEKREKLITGFSGTNDGRWLLPTSIAQRNVDHQQGTNARVLICLLQPENDSYAMTHGSGQRWSTIGFLQTVAAQQPDARVLLDVGAQILDFSNLQVAKAWLDITRDADGAIYFNKNDELMVLMRNGSTVPLLSSSLSQQLDRCIVYLDHAHTRGTDIKLPIRARAAVTLGPKVTKDRLVQGCMRMRKLGHGHSVMFFAPPEVDRSIRALSGKTDSNTQVTTVDILNWTINETWSDIQQRAPNWAQQGMNHKIRYDAWADFANKNLSREKLGDAWLQPDLKSLADLYGPSESKNISHSLSRLDPEIRQRLKNLGVLSLPNAQMEEEQEREVNREREREREIELPPMAKPAEHYFHPDVVEFVNTGNIPSSNGINAFHPIFTTLERSSAATREANVWSPLILATTDFCNTIKLESTRGTIDQYLRPVQWILSRKTNDSNPLLVLLSPFEVDRLMPDIRASEHVHLHLYTPRTSQRMKPSDDLNLYTIPPLPSDWTPPWVLIDQLNVFAGQLYIRDYNSYLRLCRFLGVPTKELTSNTEVRWNMFNIPGSIEENEIRFSDSPLPSVMALLSIRSRGRPFARTHMGQILQGQLLTANDFEPRAVNSSRSTATRSKEALQDMVSGDLVSLPVGMECDALPDRSEPSGLVRPSKRGLEMAKTSDASPESPKKRSRID